MYRFYSEYDMTHPHKTCKNADEISLMNKMRLLWVQHVAWARACRF